MFLQICDFATAGVPNAKAKPFFRWAPRPYEIPTTTSSAYRG
jgi:hypothetical protein